MVLMGYPQQSWPAIADTLAIEIVAIDDCHRPPTSSSQSSSTSSPSPLPSYLHSRRHRHRCRRHRHHVVLDHDNGQLVCHESQGNVAANSGQGFAKGSCIPLANSSWQLPSNPLDADGHAVGAERPFLMGKRLGHALGSLLDLTWLCAEGSSLRLSFLLVLFF